MPKAPPVHCTAGPLERVRSHLLKLTRVAETLQWGGNLVYWTMDKAIGGKMFALIDTEAGEMAAGVNAVIAFAAGPTRKLDLLKIEGVVPAPYLARAHWVALQHWQALPMADLLQELTAAIEYVFDRLPPRVQRLQQTPLKVYRDLVREKRSELKRL